MSDDSTPTLNPAAQSDSSSTPAPATPQTIGRYRILEALGVGGMGTVFKAEQRTPVKRVVALKLIKPGFDTQQVVARFQSERQALARMDHPNIAKILDAGADEHGRPYFVMEYVPGVPITTFCDKNKLSIRQRLLLFIQVCDAINHAHTKALLHRDIKASNVLAYLHDGKPAVKVIDFGVAKALAGDRLTEETLNTGIGKAIGTYESMSPEQADGSPDIDTRTDVYSLGVLLYELLTGTPPFDRETLARAGDEEIRRIIREVEPPRPSTKIVSLAETGVAIATARQARLEHLARELKSELEWIPLKAMRKERDRRYASALQMAEDVENYLEHRPLIAGPESRYYRATKFFHKYRLATSAVIIIATLLVGQVISSEVLYLRAQRALSGEKAARQLADKQRAEADAQRLAATEARATADHNAYAAGLAAAQASLGTNDLQAARRHLLATPESLRGIEWNLLWAELDDSVATLYGHTGSCFCTAYSPDGKWIASGGGDGNVLVFDAHTGERVQTLLNHLSSVRTVAFAPDSNTLAAASDDGKVRVWRIDQAKLAQEIVDPDGVCRAVAFHPRSGRLVTGTEKGNLHFWDIGSSAPARTIETPGGGGVYAIAFSANGQRIAAGTKVTHAVFETGSGNCLYTPTKPVEASDVALSANGNLLAFATGNAHRAYCVDLSEPSRQIFIGIGMSVEAGPNGTFGLISRDSIYVVDALTGQTKKTLHCGDVQLSYIGTSISPDFRMIAGGALDGRIVLTPTDLRDPLQHTSKNAIRLLSPDATRILACEFAGQVTIFGIDPYHQLISFRAHGRETLYAAWSPDGRSIATCSADQTVRLWNASDGKLIREMAGHHGVVRGVAFSPDGSRLASAGPNGELFLWSTASQQPPLKITAGDRLLTCVAFDSAGSSLAAGANDGAVYFVALPGGSDSMPEPKRMALHSQPVIAICFSPDGKRILSGSADNLAIVSDPTGVAPPGRLTGHNRTIAAVSYSTDARRIFTGSYDETARIWDPVTGRELVKFPSGGFAATIQPFPDGQRILVGNWHKTLSLDAVPLPQRLSPSTPELATLIRGSTRAAMAYRKVTELFQQSLMLPQIMQKLQSDPSLDPAMRDAAIKLAASCAKQAQFLYAQHWPMLCDRNKRNDWPAALEAMREACRQLPSNPDYATALGVAQFRNGQVDDAIKTLSGVAELDRAPDTLVYYEEHVHPPRPALLATLAIALHQQGHPQQARPYFDRLKALAGDPEWSVNPEVRSFLAEASQLLGPM